MNGSGFSICSSISIGSSPLLTPGLVRVLSQPNIGDGALALYPDGTPSRMRIRPGSLSSTSPPTSSTNPRSLAAAIRSGRNASNWYDMRYGSTGSGGAGIGGGVKCTTPVCCSAS